MPTINEIISELKKSGCGSKQTALEMLEEKVKPIKLSEIVDRLKKECHDVYIVYNTKEKAIGYNRYYIGTKIFNRLIKIGNTIEGIIPNDTNDVTDFKWLYELWINEVEIINDMEEKQ